MSDEHKDQEESAEHEQVPPTGGALVLQGLRQLLAGDVSGTIGRLTLVLVAITAGMEVLRQFGLSDSSYPFFTQVQGQALEALVVDTHDQVCSLVARSGGDPPPSCSE